MNRKYLYFILSFLVLATTINTVWITHNPWIFLTLLLIPVFQWLSESLFRKATYRLMVRYDPEGFEFEYIEGEVINVLADASEELMVMFVTFQPKTESGTYLIDITDVEAEQLRLIYEKLRNKGLEARIYQLNPPSVTESEMKLLIMLQLFEFYVDPSHEPLKSIRELQGVFRQNRIREERGAQLERLSRMGIIRKVDTPGAPVYRISPCCGEDLPNTQ